MIEQFATVLEQYPIAFLCARAANLHQYSKRDILSAVAQLSASTLSDQHTAHVAAGRMLRVLRASEGKTELESTHALMQPAAVSRLFRSQSCVDALNVPAIQQQLAALLADSGNALELE